VKLSNKEAPHLFLDFPLNFPSNFSSRSDGASLPRCDFHAGAGRDSRWFPYFDCAPKEGNGLQNRKTGVRDQGGRMGERWAVGLTENIAQVDSRILGDLAFPTRFLASETAMRVSRLASSGAAGLTVLRTKILSFVGYSNASGYAVSFDRLVHQLQFKILSGVQDNWFGDGCERAQQSALIAS
jgi:hypothetical protein